ncbi:hypothetical protein GYMLUDRAFT_87386 [Collybiopsis luxurians FD-317 M1]|uniref:Uncharacterized protein n=1 Tax=Collybiopsis luxurians FD-317 M1 TaxID=944289 RepID=A0A0D0AZD6_9AGAR|nr:hypothetical protein GYMLUDRAFT_87386 [Collybiopsis luxurians FD-317 M1]
MKTGNPLHDICEHAMFGSKGNVLSVCRRDIRDPSVRGSEYFDNICRYRLAHGECGLTLTPDNVVEHFQGHLVQLTSRESVEKVTCGFNLMNGTPCIRTLTIDDLSKHMHAKHTIKPYCWYCGDPMTLRNDMIKTHLKGHGYTDDEVKDFIGRLGL